MIEATYIDHMGNDLTIVNSARVSFGKKSDWIQRVYSGEPQLLHNKDILVGKAGQPVARSKPNGDKREI